MSVPVPPAATMGAASAAPPATPRPSGGWMTQTARLVRWELFLAWRRRGMVITLGALMLVGYALVELFLWLTWVGMSAYADQQRAVAVTLVLPASVAVAGQYFISIGTLALIVLAGALIGSEYSYGTHRLSLARGVGRGQLLMAQVIALALLGLLASGTMLTLGILSGALSGVALGGSQALSLVGAGELLSFWLAIAVNAFAYSLIALWLGTIGRSVAAAIAGPLVYIFVEFVVANLLGIYRFAPKPDAVTIFLSHVPDYLLGTNAGALIQLAGQTPYPLQSATTQLGWAHAIIMVAVYSLLFIVSAYLVFRGRDVRE